MADTKQDLEERAAFEKETGKKYGFAEIDNFLKWKKTRKTPGAAPTPMAPPPGAPAPISVSAGAGRANIASSMTPMQKLEEKARAGRVQDIQSTLGKAQFIPPEQADPMAGFGLAERAKVQELVRQGIPLLEAIMRVRPQPLKPPPGAVPPISKQ